MVDRPLASLSQKLSLGGAAISCRDIRTGEFLLMSDEQAAFFLDERDSCRLRDFLRETDGRYGLI